MYAELRAKVRRARAKIEEARAQGKMTPELEKLEREARAAFQARDPAELEKIVDQILEKL